MYFNRDQFRLLFVLIIASYCNKYVGGEISEFEHLKNMDTEDKQNIAQGHGQQIHSTNYDGDKEEKQTDSDRNEDMTLSICILK